MLDYNIYDELSQLYTSGEANLPTWHTPVDDPPIMLYDHAEEFMCKVEAMRILYDDAQEERTVDNGNYPGSISHQIKHTFASEWAGRHRHHGRRFRMTLPEKEYMMRYTDTLVDSLELPRGPASLAYLDLVPTTANQVLMAYERDVPVPNYVTMRNLLQNINWAMPKYLGLASVLRNHRTWTMDNSLMSMHMWGVNGTGAWLIHKYWPETLKRELVLDWVDTHCLHGVIAQLHNFSIGTGQKDKTDEERMHPINNPFLFARAKVAYDKEYDVAPKT